MRIGNPVCLIPIIVILILLVSCDGSSGPVVPGPPEIGFNPVDVTPDDINHNRQLISIQGNYAFVTSDGEGLKAYDISSPENPIFLSLLEYDETFRKLDTDGLY